ncbi:uncharacterized protein PAE49_021685 [Odontesthes bonariensis]|uniref:uncharacterized protein LOC142368607 n=1 Tax=Odontesthes bonariensis TaxID=219752 RepID=UPI003F589A59
MRSVAGKVSKYQQHLFLRSSGGSGILSGKAETLWKVTGKQRLWKKELPERRGEILERILMIKEPGMNPSRSPRSLMCTNEPCTSQQECRVTEKCSSLVEEKFTRLLHTYHLPKVEDLRGNTDAIISKGPGQKVQSGAAKPDEPIDKVLIKRVKLPLDLMNFIKSSGAVFKYQTRFHRSFKSPVSIEVTSDLVLSSLSSQDLDEALATVLKDLSVEIEKLQGAAAVPPDIDRIKEILIKAKNDANRGELRVDVSFVPGLYATTVAKVRLVGYSDHVNRLKELLRDYLLHQISTREELILPHPELVDCFDKVLDLLGVQQMKGTLKASHSPHPHVLVSGPRRQVQETRRSLSAALAGLISDTLVLDGPGPLRYFQGDGKVSKELVESSCQVLIRDRQVALPQVLPQRSIISHLSILRSSSTCQQSSLLFLGLRRESVNDAMKKMKSLYQAHCSSQTFTKVELADLTQDDMKNLKKLAEAKGLYVQEGWLSLGGLTVSGLKDGVNQVVQMLHTITPLRREMRIKEEEILYPRVAWCILALNGSWERLPKTANYNLENQNVTTAIVDAKGMVWTVDLRRTQAKKLITGETVKLKRLQNLPDFTLPLYWDNMATDENLRVVPLDRSSAEYRTVQEAFKKTVHKNILKIERLQNVHLRRAYEVQKKHISEKNRREGGAGERLLYHGTSLENRDAIETKGFNRSFSGKNATVFGQGTYFAVNANYSASPTYSRPAADGTQVIFVARVLTGVYALGSGDMRVPPPRSSQQPHDRYDSVVDRMDDPGMFVVFHDNQAYPDYLITFR